MDKDMDVFVSGSALRLSSENYMRGFTLSVRVAALSGIYVSGVFNLMKLVSGVVTVTGVAVDINGSAVENLTGSSSNVDMTNMKFIRTH